MDKENKQDFFSKIKIRRNFLVLTVTFPVILGLVAGVAGELLSRAYISDDAYSPPFWREVDLSSDYRGSNLVIRDAKKVVVEQDVKISETINSVSGTVAGIYKKQGGAAVKDGGFNLTNYYQADQAIGTGLILTSDGWVMSGSFPAGITLAGIINDFVVVTSDKKVYSIDKALKDSENSFYFFHCLNARDLPVRQFVETNDLAVDRTAIALSWPDKNFLIFSAGPEKDSSTVKSSENYSQKIALNEKIPDSTKGSVVYSLSGSVAGVGDNSGNIYPISNFSSVIKSLLKNGKIARPTLGIDYINLFTLTPIDSSAQKGQYDQGALIYSKEGLPGIAKGGPADLAGLKVGDIITRIDNVDIKQDVELSDIIKNYTAGDKINVQYRRAGESRQVDIKLGELE